MFSTQVIQTLMLTNGINSRGLRPLFMGEPGTGKSANIESVATAQGSAFFGLTASQNEPTDIGGMPMFDGKGGMTYSLPDWLMGADEEARAGRIAVVFLDELTTCPPTVQAAILRMVQEHQVRSHKLHPNVVWVAAANPTECAAGGYDLTPPAANRFMHLDWAKPDPLQWINGIISGWASETEALPDHEVVAKIDAGWANALARSKGTVTGFIRAQRDKLHQMPERGNPQASKAWPSGRTWELAINTMAGSSIMGLEDHEVDTLIAGLVGRGVAAEFLAYQLSVDLPDPEELLDASDWKKVFEPDPRRPDRTLAVLNSVASLVCPKDSDKRKDRTTVAWDIVGTVADDAADVAMVAARALLDSKAICPKTTRKQLLRLGPVMQAMGAIKIGS